MTTDVFGFSAPYTTDWRALADDRREALLQLTGTTDRAERDRLFDLRPALVARLADSARYASVLAVPSPKPLPAPIEATLRSLAQASAEPNWDGERSLPVETRAWDNARDLLRALPDAILRGPDLHLSMSGDGMVHVTVYRADRGRATIETGHGRFVWTWMRGLEESAVDELPTLDTAKAKLRRFVTS